MLKAWQDDEQKADAFTQVSEVGYLDEEIVCLHSEIVELQRSPFARRQADIMEQLEEKAIELYKQLKAKCKSPDPPHGYSDSSEMVKTIVQTVQNQDRILRDLYTHLSKILECKCRIVALFPKLEGAVESIKAAEAAVMTMQMKRQREFWHLLKIACAQNGSHNSLTPSSDASSPPPLTMNPLRHTHSESVCHLLDENQRYLSQLTSLLQEASQDKTCNIMDQDWSWTQYGSVVDQTLETLDTHTHYMSCLSEK
ncbi:unnamed protein product [Oncorhynchus mykiss]|uniref:I-kappa-kinase-beta NEMO binding domain-containing protein n=1 Tax=Oncorhynchus mykiss TaxID=8022 RepID=A0A060W1A6_ONCMY|nr:unnamed protein product [Oncorhynchus mykiss]